MKKFDNDIVDIGVKPNKSNSKKLTIEETRAIMQPLLNDIDWFFNLVDARIEELKSDELIDFNDIPQPIIEDDGTPYAELIKKYELSPSERIFLISSIVTNISPEKLTDKLVDKENRIMCIHNNFGGYVDRAFFSFLPTLQTVIYLLAGKDKSYAEYYKTNIIDTGSLTKEGIINLTPYNISSPDENEVQHIPILTKEYMQFIRTGVKPRPDFGKAFPATWVTTKLDWEHLVLESATKEHISQLMLWPEHGEKLIQSNDVFNVSYPCLFYGPPGTGKSLTAKLIGKKYNKDVFRVDLSMIVSKYIGETEKNLAYLFDRAEGKDWILFFDEADSLFSKRTSVGSAQDKWANLEVSYLLQRMEEHKGLTILATNLKGNIDPAMTRRFQQIVYFPSPKEAQRKKLWQLLLPKPYSYKDNISLEALAKYEFSGANISNILKGACLNAIKNNSVEIIDEWLAECIRKEFIKESRTP